VVNGVVSDEMTLDFFSRLPNMIHGVERVILNGQELQCRPPMHPKGTS
jgi:predicted ester cyclase